MPTTIIVPCHNEALRLDVSAFHAHVAEGHAHRFLFVDDGSTDRTLAIIRELSDSNPDCFAYESLPKNMGKGEAVRQGILRALDEDAEIVGFWDADLATPLDTIQSMETVLENDPRLRMIFGARVRLLGRHIERRAIRHFLGRIFATAASTMLRLPIYDTQCGAKLFRNCPEVRNMFATPFITRWIFDVELLARYIASRQPGDPRPQEIVYEYPLQRWRDVGGSKVRSKDFIRAIGELLAIYWKYLRPGHNRFPPKRISTVTEGQSR